MANVQTFVCLHIQQTQRNISIVSNIHSLFSSVFGLHQLLRETSGSLAAKCSTMFTS